MSTPSAPSFDGFLLDEGGIRVATPVTRYVSYLSIRQVERELRLIGGTVLLITTDQDHVVEVDLPFMTNIPALVASLSERSQAALLTRRNMASRRGDLTQWISLVSTSHRAGGMYRASFVDTELLEQTLADVTDVPEARAAAAHALLAEGRADIVRARIHPLSPPQLLAATYLAPGGDQIVSRELFEGILPYLDLRDRIVCTQHARAREGSRAPPGK